MTLDATQYQSWLGKTETQRDFIRRAPVVALAATLDRTLATVEADSPLPDLWHWVFFLNPVAQHLLAADGHPTKGDFLPPIPLPRRMWAGSRFEFIKPLKLGQQAERVSSIKNVELKSGRSGELAFVCVHHQVSTAAGVAFTEEHDIVYRDIPTPDADTGKTLAAPEDQHFSKEVTPDPVLLFRYSALTFNGHRIHFDREYATQKEGYPGLVVHGPLLATLLLELLHDNLPHADLSRFEFKAIHPVFDLDFFTLCGRHNDDDTVDLWVKNKENELCMLARATVIVNRNPG